ncbi:hypothetical protein BDZ88DRAFT_408997 [Geranomyces variabilis]|nr:hypothetical protein BDZ88DRAFT_408997 [Geranomyces variabilis]
MGSLDSMENRFQCFYLPFLPYFRNAEMAATVTLRKLVLTAQSFVPTSTLIHDGPSVLKPRVRWFVAGNVWERAHASAIKHTPTTKYRAASSPVLHAPASERATALSCHAARCLTRLYVLLGGGLPAGVIRGLERCYSTSTRNNDAQWWSLPSRRQRMQRHMLLRSPSAATSPLR